MKKYIIILVAVAFGLFAGCAERGTQPQETQETPIPTQAITLTSTPTSIPTSTPANTPTPMPTSS